MFNYEEFHRKDKQYIASLSTANEANKAALMSALKAAGITSITVNFDGVGDSGQIEEVTAFAGNTPAALPNPSIEIRIACWGDPEIETTVNPLPEAVEALCYGYLEQTHDGWENNDGAYGEFTIDVETNSIELDFNARFTDVDSSAHTF
jgi:hypothetical protein